LHDTLKTWSSLLLAYPTPSTYYAVALLGVLVLAPGLLCSVQSGLLLSGKVSYGSVTATGGMAASVRCIQRASDTNDRLDRILAELKDEE